MQTARTSLWNILPILRCVKLEVENSIILKFSQNEILDLGAYTIMK